MKDIMLWRMHCYAFFIISMSTSGSGSAQSTATSTPHIWIFPGIIFLRAMAADLIRKEHFNLGVQISIMIHYLGFCITCDFHTRQKRNPCFRICL